MADALLMLVSRTPLAPLTEAHCARLRAAHPRVRVEFADTPEAVSARLGRADGLLKSFALDDALLACAPRLRWLHGFGAGAEGLLTPATARLTITASKGPMGRPIAEHAIALLLALARHLPDYQRQQAARRWARIPMIELSGKTIAILGVGAVGHELARMCKHGFGMRVLGLARRPGDCPDMDRYVDRAGLPAALAEADALALCMPLTPDTKRIIDAAALAALRPGALLVNVARGGLVDEEALVAALRSGRLAGAGLDVANDEPPPDDNPLWALPNVILTPHTAPLTDRVVESLVDFWCENIRRFGAGEPLLGTVDREAGY